MLRDPLHGVTQRAVPVFWIEDLEQLAGRMLLPLTLSGSGRARQHLRDAARAHEEILLLVIPTLGDKGLALGEWTFDPKKTSSRHPVVHEINVSLNINPYT